MRVVNSRYLPHPKQVRFHKAPELYRLFLAGIGTGKTLAGVHECIAMSLANPLCDGCIVEPTYAMIRDVMLPVWKEWIDESLYRLYKSEGRIELWTGQSIFLRSAENPERIRGLNLAWAWGDELAQVQTNDVWRILQGRIRDPRAKKRGLFATTTPKGWNWLAKLFLQAKSDSYRWIRARTSDNPYLPTDFVSGLRADYGEEFAAQELDAEILELQGLVWPINPRVHCRFDKERAISECDHFVVGVDWGYSNPSAIVVGGINNATNTWYVLEEWRKARQLTENIIDQLKRFYRKYRFDIVYADPAEPDRIREVKNAGFACRAADRSKSAGLAEVRSLLAVRGDGKPRMYLSPTMRGWMREQEDYHYVEDTEDVIGDSGDHLMDATRYMVHSWENRREVRGRVAA